MSICSIIFYNFFIRVLPWDACPMKLVHRCHQTLWCKCPWKEPQRSSATIGHRNLSFSLESLSQHCWTGECKKSEKLCENLKSDALRGCDHRKHAAEVSYSGTNQDSESWYDKETAGWDRTAVKRESEWKFGQQRRFLAWWIKGLFRSNHSQWKVKSRQFWWVLFCFRRALWT